LAIKAATLKQKQVWLVLAQGWCGDCAQIIPILGKIADAGKQHIDLRIFNPDENPELMDAYLTNGSRSIPKLIILRDESLSEISLWGPRPAPAQKLLMDWKNLSEKSSWSEFEKELHTWYARDRTMTTQEELDRLSIWD
jgi:thiol-disulfide isomerase/thioredoxin